MTRDDACVILYCFAAKAESTWASGDNIVKHFWIKQVVYHNKKPHLTMGQMGLDEVAESISECLGAYRARAFSATLLRLCLMRR